MNTYSPLVAPHPPREPCRFYAEKVFEQIQYQCKKVAENAGQDEDIEVMIPLSNGQQIIMESMGYQNPSFIIVRGYDENGDKVTALLSHTSIQAIIKIVKRQPAQKKTMLGFLGQIDPPAMPTEEQ